MIFNIMHQNSPLRVEPIYKTTWCFHWTVHSKDSRYYCHKITTSGAIL